MEDDPKPHEGTTEKKIPLSLTQRLQRHRLEHIDILGQGLDKVGYLVGQTLDGQNVFDKVTYESERFRSSHSETSSRRNSDEKKTNKLGLRTGKMIF